MRKFELIRNEIKKFSDKQKDLKPQRKTKYFKGERTVPAWKAVEDVDFNRHYLMHLYLAYATIKGKEVVYPTKVEYYQTSIDKLVEKFKPAEEVV